MTIVDVPTGGAFLVWSERVTATFALNSLRAAGVSVASCAWRAIRLPTVSRIEVGQTFSFSRTFTDGDVSLYCGLTGDYNPFHLDETFASASRVGARIVPGLLTGSLMTHIGGMLGVLGGEMNFSFLEPVYIGETITCTVTIAAIDERGVATAAAKMVNQDGVQVVEASWVGKPMLVRLAPTTTTD